MAVEERREDGDWSLGRWAEPGGAWRGCAWRRVSLASADGRTGIVDRAKATWGKLKGMLVVIYRQKRERKTHKRALGGPPIK
jgi:hypothetical protein